MNSRTILKSSSNITDFKVVVPDISELLGYNFKKSKAPLYLMRGFTFIVYSNRHSKKIFSIPEKFSYDGCTIPKIFWFIIGCPHTPEFIVAALIHDYFCKDKSLIDRKTASRCLLYLLLANGVPKWKAYPMYYLVEIYQKYYNGWK